MRAQDFIAEKLQHRDGIDVEELEDAEDPNAVWIQASSHGRELGRVRFHRSGDTVVAQELEVQPEYRGQGIAKIMYDYARELGYRVLRSAEQTAAGRRFWEKNRPQQGVWESELAEVNAPGELSVDKDLIDRFTAKGWDIIGEGQDQIVLMKPGSNTVLKIVGSGSPARREGIRRYIKFFRANQRDPHYPRVGPDREFDWKGQKYYAYTQERLFHLPHDEEVLDYLEQALHRMQSYSTVDEREIPPGITYEEMEGIEQAVSRMFEAGFSHMGYDMSNIYNLMQRANGQMVIVDPFSSLDDELDEDAVSDLEQDLQDPYSYDAIDHMMQTIAKQGGITAKELHDRFVEKHGETPDDWIRDRVKENFDDGKKPGRRGLSRRVGIPKKATLKQLEKIAGSSTGERRRMAQWQLNMRRGKAKKVKEVKILSQIKGKGSEPSQLPRYGRAIEPEREEYYLGQQIGRFDGYTIWRDWLGGQLSYHLFDPRERRVILTTFGSQYKGNPNSYIIHGLYAAPGNTVKAHQFYRALIIDQGITLISDRKQSPGGNRVWQNLERYPDIEIYGYDTKTGDLLNFGSRDLEMYTIPAGAVKNPEGKYIANNIRLVATAR